MDEEYVSPFANLYTPARHLWLHRLDAAVFQGVERARGRTGYDCMQLGLTQWQRLDGGGLSVYEELTPMGQQALKEWNDEHGKPVGTDTPQP